MFPAGAFRVQVVGMRAVVASAVRCLRPPAWFGSAGADPAGAV